MPPRVQGGAAFAWENHMPQTAAAHNRQVNLIVFSLLSIVVGIGTGLGAVFLRRLIGFIHNVFFLGDFSLAYNANIPTPPSPFGAWIILVPVIGGVVVVYLVKNFAPEAKGHGVPEVMDAIYYNRGKIRPIVVVIKSLASALSIGTGASVGREGPIVQIGSGIGSFLGQRLHLREWQVITLVAAGAGGGIAATFNTPLGAVMFAVELMLPEISARTFLPVVLATGAATYIGRIAFGGTPAFLVISYTQHNPFVPLAIDALPLYVLLGIVCGLASWLFIWLLHWMEDRFDGMPTNDYVRNFIGMLSIGILMYVMLRWTGSYQTAGVGYATIQTILNDGLTTAWVLAVLFLAKLLATTVSLGSGVSGGIFSPALFMGATLGGAFGALVNMLWPHLGFSPVSFALVGMAGMIGGSTGATMTAILMLFELTGDYNTVVAATIAVATAIGIRRVLQVESIYTMKLARRGKHIPQDDHRAHMFQIRSAKEVMDPVIGGISVDDLKPGYDLSRAAADAPSYAVVTNGRRIDGIVEVNPENPSVPISPLYREVGIARETNLLESIMQRMEHHQYRFELVVRGGGVPRLENVVGVITREKIADAVLRDYRK